MSENGLIVSLSTLAIETGGEIYHEKRLNFILGLTFILAFSFFFFPKKIFFFPNPEGTLK